MQENGLHIHEPGRLSRWGVVDVGLRCVHSCKFCYYVHLDGADDPFAGMRHAKFLPPEHLLALAGSLKANGFLGFDVTGGEPTLAPGIVSLIRRATDLGLSSRIITLGQFLMRPMKSAPGHASLLDGLLEAGLSDFLFSVHAVDEEGFRSTTGESWPKLRAAMDRLDAMDFTYCTNTTVFQENFHKLPDIATEIASRNVYVANFIVMNAYYAWSRPGVQTKDVQGHYSEIQPYLLEARDILEQAGIAVNVRYAPLCTMKGMERNLVGIAGVRHDPHEWMNAIEHMNTGEPEAMGARLHLKDHETNYPLEPAHGNGIVARRAGKVFPESCRGCGAINVCDGLDPRYRAERGDGELNPYTEFRGDLLDRDRIAYRAAHVVKLKPDANPRRLVRELLKDMHVAPPVARAAA